MDVVSDSRLSSKVLSFDLVETEDVKLLEVETDDMLECLVQGKAVIKAVDPAEKVVLCTQDKTFAVKSVETSNNLFLIEDATCLRERQREEGETRE